MIKLAYLYRLYNKDKEMIYIGKTSNNPKLRIRTHFSNYSQYSLNDLWRIEVRYYDYIQLSTVDVSIYEIYLINKYRTKYNDQYKYRSNKTSLNLPELTFSNIYKIEELGIDIYYYIDIYEKLRTSLKNNQSQYTLEDKRQIIILTNNKLYELITELENEIIHIKSRYWERDLLILNLIIGLGLKTSELLDLNIVDYNYEERYITIGDSLRELPITNKIDTRLFEYYDKNDYFSNINNKIELPIFVSQHDRRLSARSIQIMIKKYFNLTPNEIRSFFINNALTITDNHELLSDILNISVEMLQNKYLNF